jgi:hypothetical protein
VVLVIFWWRGRKDHLVSKGQISMKFARKKELLPHKHAARCQRDLVAKFENHGEIGCTQCSNNVLVRGASIFVLQDTPVQKFSKRTVVKPTFPTITTVVINPVFNQKAAATKKDISASGVGCCIRMGLYLFRIVCKRQGSSRCPR